MASKLEMTLLQGRVIFFGLSPSPAEMFPMTENSFPIQAAEAWTSADGLDHFPQSVRNWFIVREHNIHSRFIRCLLNFRLIEMAIPERDLAWLA